MEVPHNQPQHTKSFLSKKKLTVILIVIILIGFAVFMVCVLREVKECDKIDANRTTTVSPPTTTERTGSDGKKYPWDKITLPDFVKPIRYQLKIHPNLETKTFQGKVDILLESSQSTSFFILHSRGLHLVNPSLISVNKLPVRIGELVRYDPWDQLYVNLRVPLKKDTKYWFTIHFMGELGNSPNGIYLNTYSDHKRRKFMSVATQFEPGLARSAFPCFDNFNLKTVVQLSIVRPKQFISVSNMPLLNSESYEEHTPGLMIDNFRPSPSMNLRSISFFVGNYTSIKNKTKSQIDLGVYAAHHQSNQTTLSMNLSSSFLKIFEDYLQSKFPLEKLDFVALPNHDNSIVAPWGLVLLDDFSILYYPGITAEQEKAKIVYEIAHSMANQWFGNLVTMDRWSNIWLDNSLATSLAYFSIDKLMPEYKIMDQFSVDVLFPALDSDTLFQGSPLVKNESAFDHSQIPDFQELTESVSLSKGASLLHMIKNYVGDSTFKNALRKYVLKYKFTSANISHLWGCIDEFFNNSENVNVTEIMKTWTMQKGFPFLHVAIDGIRGRITFEQQPFLFYTDHDTDNVDTYNPLGYIWKIPVACITDLDEQFNFLLTKPSDKQKLKFGTKWIKCNGSGFYRISYHYGNWKALQDAISTKDERISNQDFAKFIDDCFALTLSGRADIKQALNMLQLLPMGLNENDWVVWKEALRLFYKVNRRLYLTEPTRFRWKEYFRRTIRPLYNLLKWKDEGTFLIRKLRSEIIDAATYLNVEDAVQEALKYFENWKKKKVNVPTNVKSAVYKIGVRWGGRKDFFYCWSLYRNTTIASERLLLAKALTATRDPDLIQHILEWIFEPDRIMKGDAVPILRGLARNSVGRFIVWRFVRLNWKKLSKEFGLQSASIRILIESVVEPFNTELELNEAVDFFSKRLKGSTLKHFKKIAEKVDQKISWLEKFQRKIDEWLDEKLGKSEI